MTKRTSLTCSSNLMLFLGAWVILIGIPDGHASSEGGANESADFPLSVLLKIQPRLEIYLNARTHRISELVSKYEQVIEARFNKATDAGDLKMANAFQGEKKLIEILAKELEKEPEDLIIAVLKSDALPDLPADAPETLVSLRKIWTVQWRKIRIKFDGELQQSLKKLEIELTKARDLDKANRVLAYRESLLAHTPAPPVATLISKRTKVTVATKAKPFENSLVMRFVPVPITGGTSNGRTVLFSIWETRVKDYEAFMKKNGRSEWPKPDFKQKDDHPAVNVSWEDAVAFCNWLTATDRKKGKIGKNEQYRLPTDHEWSCAVGIGEAEDADLIPSAKHTKIADVYFWGKGVPPPKGAGNYYGEETKSNPIKSRRPIEGYDDGYDRTGPVGSFNMNEYGLYDMGGNVWEWCGDWFSTKQGKRVLRGSSWFNGSEVALRSSYRNLGRPAYRDARSGFRCVLVVDAGAPVR